MKFKKKLIFKLKCYISLCWSRRIQQSLPLSCDYDYTIAIVMVIVIVFLLVLFHSYEIRHDVSFADAMYIPLLSHTHTHMFVTKY